MLTHILAGELAGGRVCVIGPASIWLLAAGAGPPISVYKGMQKTRLSGLSLHEVSALWLLAEGAGPPIGVCGGMRDICGLLHTYQGGV